MKGWCGRALIYAVLRRRGGIARYFPPISLLLAADAVNKALHQLVELGILAPLNERKWGRAWECGELLELVEDFDESVRLGPTRKIGM